MILFLGMILLDLGRQFSIHLSKLCLVINILEIIVLYVDELTCHD